MKTSIIRIRSNRKPSYTWTLGKENEGYIFRRDDNKVFGWDGHHQTPQQAFDSALSMGAEDISDTIQISPALIAEIISGLKVYGGEAVADTIKKIEKLLKTT